MDKKIVISVLIALIMIIIAAVLILVLGNNAGSNKKYDAESFRLATEAAESENYANFNSVEDLIKNNKKTIEESKITKIVSEISQEETLSKKDNLKNNWTEAEVLERFKAYLEFSKEWIYSYKLYDYYNSVKFSGDDRTFVKINSSEYKTSTDLINEIGRFYESGYPVDFVKESFVDKNGALYFAYWPTDTIPDREISDLKVKKQSDGNFKITYTSKTVGYYDEFISDEEVLFKPNSKGKWFFYDVSSNLRENND